MLLKDLLVTLKDTGFRIYDIFDDIIYDSFIKEYENIGCIVEYFDFPVKSVTTIKAMYGLTQIVIHL